MDLKVMVYQLTGFPQEGASQRQLGQDRSGVPVHVHRCLHAEGEGRAALRWFLAIGFASYLVPWHLIASNATTLKPEQLHAGSEESLRLIPPEQSVKKVTLLAMMSRSEGTGSQPAAPCMSRSGRFNTTQGIGGAVYLQAGAIRGRGRSKASAL